jgi:drug/metabolite transporter (DMT)-like permease
MKTTTLSPGLKLLIFVITPIIISTLGEFILKYGVNGTPTVTNFETLSLLITHVPIIVGITFVILGAVLWLIAMSKYELCFLYPFLSLNYIAIVLGSQIFLKEEVSLVRYISAIFIVIGLIFISRSPYTETKK